jgi:hypothetical protein
VVLRRAARGLAGRVERHRRDPATAEALAARLEDDARVDPLRDDAMCRWLAPEVLERLPAARDGRTARSGRTR